MNESFKKLSQVPSFSTNHPIFLPHSQGIGPTQGWSTYIVRLIHVNFKFLFYDFQGSIRYIFIFDLNIVSDMVFVWFWVLVRKFELGKFEQHLWWPEQHLFQY
mgnify:CR=1 FL=1